MRENYVKYLKTEEWQKKRIERLKIDNFKCCRCGSPHNIQVHHLSYRNIGNEDVYNDLITLCDSCHESIEKETISGCVYTKPIACGSNYGIKEIIPLPADSAIIFSDMRDIDIEKQVQLKGGIIRLCTVHLAPSDFLNDKSWYNEYKYEIGNLPDYDEYQWEDTKNWYVFVEKKKWIHEVISNVVRKGSIHVLQNGIKVLHVDDSAEWEAYCSPTKAEAEETHQLLDELEGNYRKIIMS